MGVVFSGMFGLGVVLFVSVDTNVHLDHILFGNLLGVSVPELWRAGLIGAVVTGGILLFWKDLMLHAFDPAQARAAGLRSGWLHYGLLSAIALTVIAVLSAAGLILAVGLLIAPGATAFLLTRSFGGHDDCGEPGLRRGPPFGDLPVGVSGRLAGGNNHTDADSFLHPGPVAADRAYQNVTITGLATSGSCALALVTETDVQVGFEMAWIRPLWAGLALFFGDRSGNRPGRGRPSGPAF